MSNQNDPQEIAAFIQQAILNPHLSLEETNDCIDSSLHYKLGGICTSLIRLEAARNKIGKQKVKLISVIAFPFGFIPTENKRKEAECAAEEGAEELELVPDFASLTDGDLNAFALEISYICELGIPVRIVLDMSRLKQSTLQPCIEAAIDAGATGVQTSNGFGPPVSIDEVTTLNKLVRGRCEIKAVGGIKTVGKVLDLINAGANKIGTSFGPELMQEFRTLNK